jgi:hypothetical protein
MEQPRTNYPNELCYNCGHVRIAHEGGRGLCFRTRCYCERFKKTGERGMDIFIPLTISLKEFWKNRHQGRQNE